MGIDVWEVVDAAATKPFGFQSFQPGPGPRRPLHPARPLLPLVEGARVRLLGALHRARRRGQQQHAVLLPLGDLAGAEPRAAAVGLRLEDPDPRRRLQGRHRRRARDAGREADRAAAHRRRRRRLPRPARPRVRRDDAPRRSSPRPTTASRSSPPTRRSTTATSSSARRSSSTSATPRAGTRSRGRCGSSSDPVRIAQVGLGAWGENLVRNLDVLADLTGSATPRTSGATRSRGASRTRARPAPSTSCSPTPSSRRS